MLTLPNYQIGHQIYESVNSRVYRGQRKKDNQPVILKILKQDYPTTAELTRYRQEYEITKSLNLDGVVKTYNLEKYQNTLVIILEDFGGQSLKQLMTDHPLTVKTFLPLVIQLTDILGQIHAAHIIHKDINPANIVWNQATNQLKIIDFGIASRLPRENPTLKNPEQLEGTLAYISPEQTGRMNCALDYRTDLYSLGVTFYELLTNKLPFQATNALELVHCHLAKAPVPIEQINPNLPQIISDIVMKLLAKNVENRYQSAFGLKADLAKCQLNTKLDNFSFNLAQDDFSGQFQIPQKLYGRDNEIKLLLETFERVSFGRTEMMLVAGYSGVGKTALVHEVHKPMTQKRGYFAAGKFDQYQRNRPYSALTQAFNEFCRYLLMENAPTLANWQTKILKAVGHNGQVIIDVIPDLELIIGKQPVVTEVGPTEAQNRFNQLFLNFIKVLCDQEHPFILFIDDLQWVDSASLGLLKSMMLDDEIQYLLIIGAYRDNEVDGSHPFIMTIDELEKIGAAISTIKLANLQPTAIKQLLQDSLKSEVRFIQPLIELIYQKTQGNAFFTHQFLQNLYENQLLQFNFEQYQWQWNVEQIAAQNITANVVELMANKIARLPKQTVAVLQLAACIGNQFELSTLAIIYQQNQKETLSALWDAIVEDLIQPLDENYKQLEMTDKASFKFSHDRVQQAAYSCIDDPQKQAIHLQIGRLLLANTLQTQQAERIFELVGHLNFSRALISQPAEKLQLAKLNLMAGKKAKVSIAYKTAVECLTIGITLLPKNCWQQQYSLTLEMHQEQAECEYLCGHLQKADQLFNLALDKAKSDQEKASLCVTLVLLYASKAELKKGIESGIKGLKLCGVNVPVDSTELKTQIGLELEWIDTNMGHRTVEELLNLPAMTDSIKFIAMQLCINLLPSAYMSGNLDLYVFLTLQMVKISLVYGHSSLASHGYSVYGAILTMISDDYERSYLFGKLGLKLSYNYNNTLVIGKNNLVFGAFVSVWKEHARTSLEYLNTTFLNSVETGDISYAGYARLNRIYLQLLIGITLENFEQEALEALKFIEKTKDQTALDCCIIFNQWLQCLQGKTRGKYDLSDETFHWDDEIKKINQTKNNTVLFYHLLASLQLSFLYGAFEKALDNAHQILSIIDSAGGTLGYTHFFFYYSLTLIAGYPNFSQPEQAETKKILENTLTKIKTWKTHCPDNFQHFYLLISAEIAKLEGRSVEAITLYDQAIQAAQDNEYLHHEALANELAALFCQANGWEKFTKVYLQEAHYLYTRWGATAKVQDLEAKYPQLLAAPKMFDSNVPTTVTAISSNTTLLQTSTVLDLDSITKASQTLAGEIILSKLLEKMMQIVIENAGAERGFLLLPNDNQWVIEAEGTINKKEVVVLHSLLIENYLPEAIINYVARTQENIVLVNARQKGPYTENEYIKAHQTQSVLCFPIIYQQQLRAILYLENNLTTGAFTPQRLNVLQMLSSQIAISLENAEYANHLEEKVKQRTAELAQANQKITTLNDKLKEENLRMSAELDIAKQLQQMVLPKETELEQIKNLDIAGFMTPADEVGGDYYEILNHNGRIKIGIGDVTGHGLESGVLMLMVQTTVRALLLAGIDHPEQFLNIINQTIYHNAQRMGTNKNLTLSLLDYQNGTLQLTGQHEEVLLVRQSGQIERIDTFDLGFMIGITDNILKFASHQNISLQPGDGIVLYTDGITEARNLEGELYGIERLCEVVSRNWLLTAQEIQQAVVADVKQYIGRQKVFDDITLLVLKQN